MDLAELGLSIKTEDLLRADKGLEDFVQSANKATAAADKFEKEEAQVSRASQKLQKDLNGTSKTFTFMKSAIGSAALTLGGIFGGAQLIRSFITNTSDAAAVQAQLATALQSTRGASGQTVESLNAHSAALQRMTNYEDDAIGKSQALLLTFTKIGGDVFPRATSAILDLAQRMGGDLQGATIQVGKALNNPIQGITALGRAGIQFTASQKEMIAAAMENNDILKAQEIILGELTTQFGGSARAARETLGGALTSLGNAFGNLFEVSGPGTETLRMSIESLITAISDPAFMSFINMIGTLLFQAISLAVNALSMLSTAVPIVANALLPLAPLFIAALGPTILGMVTSLATAIGGPLMFAVRGLFMLLLTNPITAIVAAIAGLLVYMVDWEAAIERIIVGYGRLKEIIGQALGDEGMRASGIEIQINATKAVEGLKSAATDLQNKMLGGFDAGGDDAAGAVGNALSQGGTDAAGKIGAAMKDGAASAASIYEGLNGKVIEPLGKVLVDGGNYFKNEVTGEITKAGKDAAGSMGAGTAAGGETAGQHIQKAMGAGSKTVYNTIEAAFATLAPLMDVFEAFYRRERAELNKLQAETALLTQQAMSERQNRNRGGGSGSSGSGDYGGSGSGSSSSSSSSGASGGLTPRQSFDEWKLRNGMTTGSVSYATDQSKAKTVTGSSQGEVKVTIYNELAPKNTLAMLKSAEGAAVIKNVLQVNRDEVAAILGVS